MRVHYYGHVGQSTGYAVAAEQTCKALLTIPGVELCVRPLAGLNIKLASMPIEVVDRIGRHEFDNGDVAIVHTLPLDCERVLEQCASKVRMVVAYTTWEAQSAPELVREALHPFDQVWFPSAISAAPFRSPIVVPHAFDDEALRDVDVGADRKPEDTYRFYYVGAWISRKNPAGLIRAYAHAFKASDNVELHLQCAGASTDALLTAVAQLGIPQNELPKIRFSSTFLTADQLADLHRRCDCFVTASRGEAWNLPCFDAMLYRRHIIAPGNLGSNEYLLGTSWQPVNWDLQPALVDVAAEASVGGAHFFRAIGAQGLTAKSVWCDPNLLHLATKMRQAVDHNDRSLKVHYNISERFGYEAIGKKMLSLFDEGLRSP